MFSRNVPVGLAVSDEHLWSSWIKKSHSLFVNADGLTGERGSDGVAVLTPRRALRTRSRSSLNRSVVSELARESGSYDHLNDDEHCFYIYGAWECVGERCISQEHRRVL